MPEPDIKIRINPVSPGSGRNSTGNTKMIAFAAIVMVLGLIIIRMMR